MNPQDKDHITSNYLDLNPKISFLVTVVNWSQDKAKNILLHV